MLYFSECKVNKTHILLVNIYLAGENNSEYSTALLCEMIDKLLINRKNIIIIGDFHSLKNVEGKNFYYLLIYLILFCVLIVHRNNYLICS